MLANKEYVKCIDVPPKGQFVKNKLYRASAVIDALGAYDENDELFLFEEHRFLWYFAYSDEK